MSHEIELKLALPESAHRAFMRQAVLGKATTRHSGRLVNIYYDTPSLELHRHGIALRLRRKGAQWLQTVKCAGESAAGLSARPEWETPYAGRFDFSAVDAPKVRGLLEKKSIRERIAPVFETNFLRTAWRFGGDAGVIELAFDRGWIAAAGRREVISELELEIISGHASRLFELARALAGKLPLAPALLSKAERGYRLFQGVATAPHKAGAVALVGDMAPQDGFRMIALGCLEHMLRNHDGAAGSDDPEYIHQMRVGARRLRAALRLFAPLLPSDLSVALLPLLRRLMGELGRARDLDVLLVEIAAPVLAALPGEPRLAALVGLITERRHRDRHAATQFLRTPVFGQFALLALELLHRVPVQAAEASASATLATFAHGRVRRLRKKVIQLAGAAQVDDPTSLHALRIGVKRLRYALEFFAPLTSGRAHVKVATRLVRLQEALGQINDLANAGILLMDCAGEDHRLREAVTLIGGWHGPHHARLLANVPGAVRALHRLKPPRFA